MRPHSRGGGHSIAPREVLRHTLAMQNFWNLSGGAMVLLLAASVVVLVEGFYLHKVGTNLASVCMQVSEKWQSAHPFKAEKYTGAAVEVNFKSENFPKAKNFKTAISDAVTKGPNFAGHYTVAEWGCGTTCQDHVVVDVQTGEIVATGIPSEVGLSYSIGSPLLIANPAKNIPKASELEESSLNELLSWTRLSRDYYAIEEQDGRASLNFLCTENLFDGEGL